MLKIKMPEIKRSGTSGDRNKNMFSKVSKSKNCMKALLKDKKYWNIVLNKTDLFTKNVSKIYERWNQKKKFQINKKSSERKKDWKSFWGPKQVSEKRGVPKKMSPDNWDLVEKFSQ